MHSHEKRDVSLSLLSGENSNCYTLAAKHGMNFGGLPAILVDCSARIMTNSVYPTNSPLAKCDFKHKMVYAAHGPARRENAAAAIAIGKMGILPQLCQRHQREETFQHTVKSEFCELFSREYLEVLRDTTPAKQIKNTLKAAAKLKGQSIPQELIDSFSGSLGVSAGVAACLLHGVTACLLYADDGTTSRASRVSLPFDLVIHCSEKGEPISATIYPPVKPVNTGSASARVDALTVLYLHNEFRIEYMGGIYG